MAQAVSITVNVEGRTVSADPDTPLLYVLMNELNLRGRNSAAA
jgi:aerobic-type carbon monoxide dehydrogenase small subunit (CoxS/CutS family)